MNCPFVYELVLPKTTFILIDRHQGLSLDVVFEKTSSINKPYGNQA